MTLVLGKKLLLLALGGGAGTMARWGLAGLVQRLAGSGFPVGTFAVNLAGCLCFGALWGFFENRLGLGGDLRLFALTGFMGAFTTFSTYMFETAQLTRHGQMLLAAANVAGQTALGLVLLFAGLALGRWL